MTEVMDNDAVFLAIARLEKRTKRKKTSTADPAAVSRVVRAKSHLKFLQSQTVESCERSIKMVEDQMKSALHLVQVLRSRKLYYQELIDNRDSTIEAAKEQVQRCEAYVSQTSREDDLSRLETLVAAMDSCGLSGIEQEDLERVFKS